MFGVVPKDDCPHQTKIDFQRILNKLSFDSITSPCCKCEDASENWLCLECEETFCSRYVNSHMSEHYENHRHSVALSFTDGSFWCYSCDSYVNSPELRDIGLCLGEIKFPTTQTIVDVERELFNGTSSSSSAQEVACEKEADDGTSSSSSAQEVACEKEADAPVKPRFTRDDLVDGLRSNKFKRVSFMTGAGISVAAGIPDFRTPGTGLYAKVAELGLPYPEAIFSLDYLRERPIAFYKVAKGFLTHKVKPVQAHYFIKKFADEGILQMNYTQNIDGLELDAGISLDHLVQAHGHMRSAHCIDCQVEGDMAEFYTHVDKKQVLYCHECNGIVKPDIVFFGEQLPTKFASKFYQIEQSDLVVIMGTSLKVYPFASLLSAIAPDTPVVLLNRENPGLELDNLLFIPGDIEDSVAALARDVGWELEEPLTSISEGDAEEEEDQNAKAD